MNAFNFTFTTREEYLQQKKEWFFAYKEAVQRIRARKNAYKDVQRGKISWGEWSTQYSYASTYGVLDALIKARSESRVEANRQYHASKEVQVS